MRNEFDVIDGAELGKVFFYLEGSRLEVNVGEEEFVGVV